MRTQAMQRVETPHGPCYLRPSRISFVGPSHKPVVNGMVNVTYPCRLIVIDGHERLLYEDENFMDLIMLRDDNE